LKQAGGLALIAIMATVWLADIAAYFSGRAFGRHKLAPSISPGKTWEGALGGGLAVVVYGFVLAPKLPVALAGNLALLFVVLVLLTVISVIGDLFESLLKRQAGLKDSSSILPGHGGVLDRIDSLTSTLPLVALVWLTSMQ
jgi:phosphatidate cytidylyltransferase